MTSHHDSAWITFHTLSIHKNL